MKSNIKSSFFRFPLLIGLLFSSVQGFGQVQKMNLTDFQSSSAVSQETKQKLQSLLEGEFPTVELTIEEDFYIGEGELKVVSLNSSQTLFAKLSALESKTTVELIMINLQSGDSLPEDSVFQSFSNLKFIIVKGNNISSSQINAPNIGAGKELYLLIRTISAD